MPVFICNLDRTYKYMLCCKQVYKNSWALVQTDLQKQPVRGAELECFCY